MLMLCLQIPSRVVEVHGVVLDDPELADIIQYVRNGKVPNKSILAKWLILESAQHHLMQDILHYENPYVPRELLVVVPISFHNEVM